MAAAVSLRVRSPARVKQTEEPAAKILSGERQDGLRRYAEISPYDEDE